MDLSDEFPENVTVNGVELEVVEGEDLKMMAGWDCELANASKFIVGGGERVEGHLRQEHSVAKSVQIVIADV